MYYWLGESKEFDFILLVFCQYFQHEIYDKKIRMLNFFISDIHLSPILQVYSINFSTFAIIKSILRALQVKHFSKINVRKDGNSECNDKDLF